MNDELYLLSGSSSSQTFLPRLLVVLSLFEECLRSLDMLQQKLRSAPHTHAYPHPHPLHVPKRRERCRGRPVFIVEKASIVECE